MQACFSVLLFLRPAGGCERCSCARHFLFATSCQLSCLDGFGKNQKTNCVGSFVTHLHGMHHTMLFLQVEYGTRRCVDCIDGFHMLKQSIAMGHFFHEVSNINRSLLCSWRNRPNLCHCITAWCTILLKHDALCCWNMKYYAAEAWFPMLLRHEALCCWNIRHY